MDRHLTFVALAIVLPLASMIAAHAVGSNIYPDPSWERSGVPGVARTGERAGTLRVGSMNHWDAIGGALEVEPFAQYRVTEWVKARVTRGTFYAPYCYQWDNFEWQFVRAHSVGTLEDWTQTQVTFISPYRTFYVHPLAYIDCEDSEAWVDDIVVEKIAEPEEAMAALEANPDRTDDENQILARWYLAKGRLEDACALFDQVEGVLGRADIACLIAQHTADLSRRRPWVVKMVAYGGPSFHGGLKRFDEITRGMTRDQRLAVAEEGVLANPTLDRAGRSFRLICERYGPGSDPLCTVAESVASLARVRASVERVLQAVPADSPTAREVQLAMDNVEASARVIQQRREGLGRCVVLIGGKPLSYGTHAIIIPDRPTEQEHYAARDLKVHLELVTGQAIPIWYEKDAHKCIPLYVGRCQALERLAPEADLPGLGLEGIFLKTVGPSLILAGNQRGVLYAVSTFLEDYLGCRWFTPDCSTWPTEGTITVPEISRRYIPPLEYRAGDYPVSRPGEFALHCRFNGSWHWLTREQGGRVGVHSLAHTFAALVPPEKYFAEHPEYFSLVNGERQSGYAQLCLTNPEVLQLCIEGVRRWIGEMPEYKVFSVSQNDTWNYCECDACTALAEEEGSQAGPIIHFVNAIADAIRDEHPDVAIETLAYQYSRKPPRHVKPRPNVIVCLCSIECCFIHPLESDEFNRSFVEDIRGWNEICQRLWIWDYIINYAHSICPFPNLYVLKPNINFFLANGVKGIYEESCYFTKGSELQELRNYIIAKTLWDPNYDVDRAIDEFCAAYYGPAAPFIRRYINLIHRSTQEAEGLHVQIYTHPRQYVFPQVIAEAKELFDQAEAAVRDDPTLLHRVQVARLPILYAEITLADTGSWTERDDRLIQERETDVAALAEQFEAIARAEGVTMVREGGPTAALDAWLQSLPRQPKELQLLRLQTPALRLTLIPELGGRFWRLEHLASGRDLLRRAGKEGAWDPANGGYEEYTEGTYRSPGFREAFAVTEVTDRSVLLTANLGNGLRLERRVELDAHEPRLTISSIITNVSGDTKKACLRGHPELQVTSTQQASVRIRRPDGTWEALSLADPNDPLAERDQWLRGERVPAGAWAVVDEAADLAVMIRVPREQLGQCLLNWNGQQARVNLECYTPSVDLAPGQTLTLHQTWEVALPRSFWPQ